MEWNKTHGVILPDIADFPDCKELKRLPKHKSVIKAEKKIQRALDAGDVKAFDRSLVRLIDVSDSLLKLSPNQEKIRAGQFARIKEMGRQHIADVARKEKISRDDLPNNQAFDALKAVGVYKDSIDSKKIEALLRPKIDKLLSEPQKSMVRGYDRSYMLSRKDDGAVFDELNKVYSKAGLLSAVTKYHCSDDLSVKSICLHVASPGDTHYNQTLKDCKANTSLVGLHFDPKYVMKSLLYLNDVDQDSGPFTYLPESHKWWFPSAQKVFAKGMSIGNYLNSPDHRQVAMQLPKRLRTNSIVGRLIPDDTPLSERLLGDEVLYTGDRGTALIFDPSTGFHRGGLCKTGQRINLQIIFG